MSETTDQPADPTPNPIPFDALLIPADIEWGGERIRATEPIMEFGPGRDHERIRATEPIMAKVSDDLLDALQRAGWGEK